MVHANELLLKYNTVSFLFEETGDRRFAQQSRRKYWSIICDYEFQFYHTVSSILKTKLIPRTYIL